MLVTSSTLSRRLTWHLLKLCAIHTHINQHITQDYNMTLNMRQLRVDNAKPFCSSNYKESSKYLKLFLYKKKQPIHTQG